VQHYICIMLEAPKKNAGRRLSSLFSMGSNDSKEAKEPSSAASSEAGSRLSKVRKRITSHSLTPDYPAPSPPPREIAATTPVTIQTVDSVAAAFAPLEPPPPLTSSNPNSRSSSPSRLSKSRPATPSTPTGALLTPTTDADAKKSRRRSRLFGYGESSDERLQDSRPGNGPLAWVVGHKGKVEYSLTMLLNGEKVRCFGTRCVTETDKPDRYPSYGMIMVTLLYTSSRALPTRALLSA
jgi:hypothetical protein